jgi:hypothetical protein
VRALLVCCVTLLACSSPVSVHGGNLIELDAAPGTAQISASGSGVSLTLTVPVVPWQGRTVAPVPLLPIQGGESWSLTYRPASGRSRSATLVSSPVSGSLGAAVIQFVDDISKTALTAPIDPEQLAVHDRNVSDLKSTSNLLKSALQQAQTVPAAVGSWKGITLNVDQSGLQFLDAAVAAAEEPPVALYSPAFAAAGKTTAAFALMLDSDAVLAMPAAADYSAAITNPTALGGDFVVEVLGWQLVPALLSADRTLDAESSTLAALYGSGEVRAQAIIANHVVESNASGAIRAGAHSAARAPPLACAPASCITGTACLDCNAVWSGCFATGASCCGSGFWSIACERGASCAICNGIWTCLPAGASCPVAFDTNTVGGSAFFSPDAGYGDAGPSGPQRCGLVSVEGQDAGDQRTFDLGKDAGTFTLDWSTYVVEDQISVVYEGRTLFDTGCVASSRAAPIPFAGASTQITVHLTGSCRNPVAGSQWEYAVGCPP